MFELLLLDTWIDFSFKPLSFEFWKVSCERDESRSESVTWKLVGYSGHLPCAGCMWVCSVTLKAGIFPLFTLPSCCFRSSCSECALIRSIQFGRLKPFRSSKASKIFWTLSSHLILACLKLLCIFSILFVVVALSFEIHTNTDLYGSHLSLYFEKKKLTLLKAMDVVAALRQAALPLKFLADF